MQSETIQNKWGYGRTTYQEFDTHEIPYITLYESAREHEKFEYKISRDNVKKLLEKLKDKKQNPTHRLEMIKELNKAYKEMEKKKEQYYTFKEFNGWSIALGWQEFEKMYKKTSIYDWNVYIEDKEFLCPTSWIKKLANKGDKLAIKEMLFRAEELSSIANEKAEIFNQKNKNKEVYENKNKQKKHQLTQYIM